MMELITSILNSSIFYNAIVAIATVAYTIGTFVLVTESRKQRKAQLRPQIDMYPEFLGGFIFYATIQNVGNNPARNIQINFDIQDKETIKTQYMKEIYDVFSKKTIPHLSPGQKYRFLIRADQKDFEIDQSITALLGFFDIEDTAYTSKVDWNLSRVKKSSINDEVRNYYKQVPENLKKINENLKKITGKR